eukprot:224147-Rhodomonas_salina.1
MGSEPPRQGCDTSWEGVARLFLFLLCISSRWCSFLHFPLLFCARAAEASGLRGQAKGGVGRGSAKKAPTTTRHALSSTICCVFATQCAVLRAGPGGGGGGRATPVPPRSGRHPRTPQGSTSSRARYQTPLPAEARTVRCPVLRWAMLLPGDLEDCAWCAIGLRRCYAMPGTDRAYGARGACLVHYSTPLDPLGLPYQPTALLRGVRY